MLADLRHARNYRQVFKYGLFVGTPLSLVQSKIPLTARASTATARRRRRAPASTGPDPGRMDGATFVALTGTLHREDEPSHIAITDPAKCVDLRGGLRQRVHPLLPGPGLPLERVRDRALARRTASTA